MSSYITPSPISFQGQAQPGPAEFAPNAFAAPPQYAQGSEMNAGGHWYDRVLDLLLGEDETLPKNRVALICQTCRLVNGQAPPGTKTLASLGKWRCFACGSLNGEEDEALKAVQEMKERIEEKSELAKDRASDAEVEMAEDEVDGVEIEAPDEDEDGNEEPAAAEDTAKGKPRRGRPKGSKKKA